MIYLIGVVCFMGGLLAGLLLGYFRLAQWYQQKTGRDLWKEVREASK